MLGHVEVSQLGGAIMEEYVSRFDVAMDDVVFVQLVQTFKCLVGHFPDALFLYPDSRIQVLLNLALNNKGCTARSPSLAKSITTHNFSVA